MKFHFRKTRKFQENKKISGKQEKFMKTRKFKFYHLKKHNIYNNSSN